MQYAGNHVHSLRGTAVLSQLATEFPLYPHPADQLEQEVELQSEILLRQYGLHRNSHGSQQLPSGRRQRRPVGRISPFCRRDCRFRRLAISRNAWRNRVCPIAVGGWSVPRSKRRLGHEMCPAGCSQVFLPTEFPKVDFRMTSCTFRAALGLLLFVATLLALGCGSGGDTKAAAAGAPSAKQSLEDLVTLLNYLKTENKPLPAKLADIEPIEPLFQGAYLGLVREEIVYVWGNTINPAAADKVLAY